MAERTRLLPLDEEPTENRDKWKVTPLSTGGWGAPQLVHIPLRVEYEVHPNPSHPPPGRRGRASRGCRLSPKRRRGSLYVRAQTPRRWA